LIISALPTVTRNFDKYKKGLCILRKNFTSWQAM
jgi:hypothetical protein